MPIAVAVPIQPSQVGAQTPLKQVPHSTPWTDAPVSKLHSDTLAAIFRAACLSPTSASSSTRHMSRRRSSSPSPHTSADRQPSKETNPKCTALALSHVSALWRSIMLGLPEVWLDLLEAELEADVDKARKPLYKRKNWLQALFRRSAPLALSIGPGRLLHPSPGSASDSVSELGVHPEANAGWRLRMPRDPELVELEMGLWVERVKGYRAVLDERGWEAMWGGCSWEWRAEMLETLSLVYRPSSSNIPMERSRSFSGMGGSAEKQPQVAMLPKGICSPKLERLSLRGCVPDLSGTGEWMENLTSLTVAQVASGGSGGTGPSAEKWLAQLGRMPKLRHVVLKEGAIAGVSARRKRKQSAGKKGASPLGMKEGEVAKLSQLETLAFDGDLDVLAGMLGRIEYPRECVVSLNCVEAVDGGNVDLVLESFAKSVENGRKSGHLTVVVLRGEGGVRISDGTGEREFELTLSKPESEDQIAVEGKAPEHPLWERILETFLDLIPSTISALGTLELQLPYAPTYLIRHLTTATKLEKLVNLTGSVTKTLLPRLQNDLPSHLTPSSFPPLPYSLPPCPAPFPPCSSSSAFDSDSDSLSALQTPLPLLPALHTLHFLCTQDALAWGSAAPETRALEEYLMWRARSWGRAVRVVEVGLERVEMGDGGVGEEMGDFLAKIGCYLLYV